MALRGVYVHLSAVPVIKGSFIAPDTVLGVVIKSLSG
jgi:hypothetical protein